MMTLMSFRRRRWDAHQDKRDEGVLPCPFT